MFQLTVDVLPESLHNERLLRAEVVLGDANRESAAGVDRTGKFGKIPALNDGANSR
jgi:hypothetical protein